MAVNAAGEVYVAGYFRGEADFGSTPLISVGYADVFLTKLDPAGDFL